MVTWSVWLGVVNTHTSMHMVAWSVWLGVVNTHTSMHMVAWSVWLGVMNTHTSMVAWSVWLGVVNTHTSMVGMQPNPSRHIQVMNPFKLTNWYVHNPFWEVMTGEGLPTLNFVH